MFDPSELTVKDARAQLSGLDLTGLEGVLQAEIDGKHRSSLIADIGRAIDALKTAEEEVEEEAAPAEPLIVSKPRRTIPEVEWHQLRRAEKKLYVACGPGLFVER